jgi:hypothetical protein
VFGLYDIPLPCKADDLDKLKNDKSAWYELWENTQPKALEGWTLDLSDREWEADYHMLEAHLLALRRYHAPAVYRDALNSFKRYDSSPVVELIDTFTSVKSIKDLLPGTALFDLIKRPMKNFYKDLSMWKRAGLDTRASTTKAYRKLFKDLSKHGISKGNILCALAASRLQWAYGIVLPAQTLAELFKSDTPEPWAQALQSYWSQGAKDALLETIGKNNCLLRARRTVALSTTVSVSLELDLAPQDMFIEYWKAFYASGILMTMEGMWDLKPLSFALDWITGGFKSLMSVLDATTVKQMIRIRQTAVTIKKEQVEQVTVNDIDFEISYTCYIRDYIDGALPTIGMTIQDFVPGFNLKFLPEAASLGYLLARK